MRLKNTSMNHPDYYHVPDEVLEAAERAIIKYLASGDVDSLRAEALTTMLMGGDWIDNHDADVVFPNNENIKSAFLYLLPSRTEKECKETDERHSSYMELALKYFIRYIDEPS